MGTSHYYVHIGELYIISCGGSLTEKINSITNVFITRFLSLSWPRPITTYQHYHVTIAMI